MLTIKVTVQMKSGRTFEVELPAKRIVCPVCDGKGSYVNPSIDDNGISPEEFNEDPDFAESYFSGVYDVRCEECHGQNVILAVDKELLPPKMLERYERNQDSEAAYRRECEAERRFGA